MGGIYELPDQSSDLVDGSLIDLVDVFFIIPEQGTENHQNRAGMPVKIWAFSNPIEEFADTSGENSPYNRVLCQGVPELACVFFLVFLHFIFFFLFFLHHQSPIAAIFHDLGLELHFVLLGPLVLFIWLFGAGLPFALQGDRKRTNAHSDAADRLLNLTGGIVVVAYNIQDFLDNFP